MDKEHLGAHEGKAATTLSIVLIASQGRAIAMPSALVNDVRVRSGSAESSCSMPFITE
jgi:hypothetical protein